MLALPWNKSHRDTDSWKDEWISSQDLAEAHDKTNQNPDGTLWTESDQGIKCQEAPRVFPQLTPGIAPLFWAAFPIYHFLFHRPQVLPYFTVLYNHPTATLLDVNRLQNSDFRQAQSHTASSVFWQHACGHYWDRGEAQKQDEKRYEETQTLRNKTDLSLTSFSLL